MDPTRSQRFGKPYYRSNYMPPSTRQALEDRLHPPGISTSSNSSWTFSNSHCDVSKPRKGRLCGIFLIGAVLVVALAVIAIGGLAFYIGGHTTERHHHLSEYQTKNNVGAKRQFSNKPSETTQKSIRTSKTPATTPEIWSTEFPQTKTIPEGAILGISETMKQFNKGLKNKKKEELTTTEMAEELTTQEIPDSEEQNPPDLVTENIEIVPEKSAESSVIKGSFKVKDPSDTVKAETKYEVVNNGHARPTYAAATTGGAIIASPNVLPPRRDYSDEPWRPIIPSYRDTVRIQNPYGDQYKDKIFERRHGPLVEPMIENDSPITFSRESYEQNLRITPEYTGSRDKINLKNNQNSRISDEIGVKYKDLVKDHRIGNSDSIAEVVVTSDDIVTAPPSSPKPSDIIIISESSSSSTLSTYYNATEDPEVDTIMKSAYPIGVDQIISGISVIESSVETSSVKATTKEPVKNDASTTKILIKTTEKTITNVTEKHKTTLEKTVSSTTVITPKATATSYATTSTPATSTKTTTATIRETPVNQTIPSNATNVQSNASVINPFLDDSRSSSSKFNFGIPDLPILKQFHNLDNLLKSFSKEPASDSGDQFSKYFVRSEDSNETTVTRFPIRTKQTTVKSYKADDTVFVEVSTISPEQITRAKPVTRKPVVIKGQVEVLSGPVRQEPAAPTTETPKLITLLPVRSNVNMMRPLRPRPKSNVNNTITITNRRKSKMSLEFRAKEPRGNQSKTSELLFSVPYKQHQIVNDENGKRWVYYSSSKSSGSLSAKNENVFIVTPEPKKTADQKDALRNLTNEPLYNTIETLLNLDYRNREGSSKNSSSRVQVGSAGTRNTSEIVNKIVKIVENVAISTGDTKIIVKKNQAIANKTKELTKGAKNETKDSVGDAEVGVSTKTVSSHYKLNQAGVPVLTKVLNKVPALKIEDTEGMTVDETLPAAWNDKKDCSNNSIRCGNGTCLPASKKCNQFIDCSDAADEKNCTCAEHLKAQQLHRKLCDGVVDCWDFTDEFNCEWCQEEFLCSNSKVCIQKDQICDGTNNCPFGDDERNCVTVSPSKKEAETFNYHYNGYLMVRRNGRWGKLCIDNFDKVSLKAKTGWKITDLGRTVCKALTFKDFDKVERMISVPNEGRSVGGSSETEKYYELAYNEVPSDRHSQRDSVLSFHETDCAKKEVVKVTCTDLECGLRPQAASQWSRIVGGGNAGPGSWPWQAALYKEGEFQCGGTVISENWLISAGHCFYHNQDAYWVARLGTLRTTLLLPSPYEQLRQISKIILHPQYIDNGFINDISLLRMRDPVKFTDYVRPICLPTPDANIVDGTMCTVVGWGQLSEIGWVFPDTLQEVQLPILSSNECRKRTIFLSLYKITDDMFCAGYDRGGRDACLGDSGGPLMCPEANGKWSLFGVTSNGYGCARSNRPGVYTKVSRYLHWIRSQMNLHSESLPPLIENEEKQNSTTSRSFTEDDSTPTPTKKNQETEYVIKLISQRVSNVKLSSDSVKRDKCKGHRCPLGECLPKSRLCNGHIECSDGSDEKDCW